MLSVMKTVAKNIGGALLMGFSWFFIGLLIGWIVMEPIDPNGEIVDVWAAALAWPGLFAGVGFFTLLRIFARARRFSDISLRRAAALGAMSALAIPVVLALLIIPSADDQTYLVAHLPTVAGLMIPAVLATTAAGVATVAYLRVAGPNFRAMQESSNGR